MTEQDIINNICGLTCVTPEEVFSTFGAISPTQPRYEYISGKMVQTGWFVLVYFLDEVIVVDIPDYELNATVSQLYIIKEALQQLDIGQLTTVRVVWMTRMTELGYGDRLKDFYM